MFREESTAERIRRRREELGWTPSELAFAAGTSVRTVNQLERGFTKNSMYLGSILSALGMGASSNVYLDVKLGVEAGQRVVPLTKPVLRLLPPPDLANAVAIMVQGDSMTPLYKDGDVLLAEEVLCEREQLMGRLCYVRLVNGLSYVMTLSEGSRPGHHTLFGQSPLVLHDVVVQDAWPVVWVRMSGLEPAEHHAAAEQPSAIR
jgi:transcriptional regulator with XRE-family HTH domain